jgi:hypothetical protein
MIDGLGIAADDPKELHQPLITLLAGHGVHARVDGDWLQVEGHSARLQGWIRSIAGAHEKASTQLDVALSPWPGTVIWESFAGVGNTREERIQQALKAFVQNSLHVLLECFLKVDCGDQVDRFEFTNDGVGRHAVHGNALSRGKAELKTGWFDALRQLLESHPIPEGTHWIRIFYGQINGRPLPFEILLDNAPWKDATPQAASIPWPKTDGFFSLRMFMVVQGGLDLRRAVGILAQAPKASDDELESMMTGAGLSVADARRATTIVPLAFGRELLAGLVKLPDTCEVWTGGAQYTVQIAAIPGFARAQELAREARREGTLSKDQYIAIVSRDSVTKAVNQVLHAGSSPEDVAVPQIIILWNEPEPFVPASAHQQSQRPSKRWWKIW